MGGEAGPTAMRTTAAVFGVLGVLALYALGVELQRLDAAYRQLSRYLPLLAAASLGAMRWHIHFSRMGIEPVLVPLVWSAAIWLLLVAWRTGRWLAYAMAGVVIAAGMYAYQGAWVIPFLTAAAALHLLALAWPERRLHPQQWSRRITGLAVAGLASVLLVAPLAWFFSQHPDLLLLRPTQLAIVGETGSPADSSLGGNVWASIKMFAPAGAAGDLDPRRNLPGAPVLNLWQALPFYAGLLVAVLRIRRPAYSIALLGLIGLLLPGVFSEYAPHYHRILGAAAPVALLCGIGLDWLWQRVAALGHTQPASQGRRRWQGLAAAALIVALLVGAATVSARDYFVRWAALPDLYYAFDEGLWDLGQATHDLRRRDARLHHAPGLRPRHARLCLASDARIRLAMAPVSFDGRHIFPFEDGPTASSNAYAVIEHEDFRTRLLLPEVFPAAEADAEFSDRDGATYARIYLRPEDSIPARSPKVAYEAALGDGIRLAGYDVLPAALVPGGSLYLQLHWLVDEAPQHDWTVFTHLVDPESGQVVAGHDSRPGAGSLPTPRWRAGWRILDEYEMRLPDNLAPGEYDLYAGLYHEEGERLPPEEGGMRLGSVAVE